MKQWGLVVMIAISLFLMPTAALELEVSTTIPEYIMDDHLNLTGSYATTVDSFVDDDSDDFSQGTGRNLTVLADSLELEPSLDVTMLNGGDPVFRGGSSSDWDYLLWGFDMIKVNGIYTLFYAAGRSPTMSTPKDIGIATSTDGISFTRNSLNPVLTRGSHVSIARPVPYYNGTWHMYYTSNDGGDMAARDRNGDYAYSDDGISWTEYAGNPVLPNGNPDTLWDGLLVDVECMLNDNGTYMLYYTGDTGSTNEWQTGLATSTDGVTWSKEPNNPVYSGNPTGWDGGNAKINTIEMANGTFRAFVSGDKGNSKVGWIWSKDGINWQDSGSALIGRTAGTIYSTSIGNPMLIDEGDHYKLYAQCMPTTSWADRAIGCFKLVPENLDGTYTSRVFDAGGLVRLIDATWDVGFTVTGDLDMQIRYGNTTGSMGEWTSLDTGDEAANVTARYFQYRIDLDVPRDWMNAYINRVEINYEAFVVSIEAFVDGGPPIPVDHDATGWSTNLSLHDGDYFIDVRVTDSLGGTVTESIPVMVDLHDPVLSFVLEEGRYATNSSTISYTLAGLDTHGPLEQMLSFRYDFLGAQWETHTPIGKLEYEGPDGSVEVYAKLKDAVGRTSITEVDTILLDTSPPEGTLLINEGADYTNSSMVTLRWNATDITGVVGMMASSDPGFEGAIWQDPMDAFSWAIGETEGTHTVYMKIRDFVGWVTVLVDDIVLDTTSPEVSADLPEYTLSRTVDFTWSASDEIGLDLIMWEIEDGEVITTVLEGTTLITDGTGQFVITESMTPGDAGSYDLSFVIESQDLSGRRSWTIYGITFIPEIPSGGILVNDGRSWTNRTTIDVMLSHTGGLLPTHFKLASSVEGLDGVAWEEWTEFTTYDLSGPGGEKAVWCQLKGPYDILSEPFSDTTKLDVMAPVVEILSPSKRTTEDESVELSVSVSDDQDPIPRVEWRLNGGEWDFYTSVNKISLKEGDNLIEVRAQDDAGNVGTAEWTVDSDRGMSVGGASWLILVVILVVVALVGVWYWRNRQREEGE